MNISDIKIVGKPLVLAKAADVDALEAELWITFPEGYREYVTKLGEGVLGGTFVRIYPPWKIAKDLADGSGRISEYWFWDAGRKVLPKARGLECVIVGDTMNGDMLVFHPSRPNRLFVLPRHSDEVFVAGENLLAAVEWMCSSGELTARFRERNFEPFDSRKQAAQPREGPADPEGESLGNLIDLGKRWAKRHGARKLAQRELKEHSGKGKTTTLLYEAIVLEGEYPFQHCYLAAYHINDEKTGRELATFSWFKTEGSYGSKFTPNEANRAKRKKSK